MQYIQHKHTLQSKFLHIRYIFIHAHPDVKFSAFNTNSAQIAIWDEQYTSLGNQ